VSATTSSTTSVPGADIMTPTQASRAPFGTATHRWWDSPSVRLLQGREGTTSPVSKRTKRPQTAPGGGVPTPERVTRADTFSQSTPRSSTLRSMLVKRLVRSSTTKVITPLATS
jgi:hypothetical protein